MARIKTTETGLYRIPLTVTLSDSTHGEIKAFELVTCRVRDADGTEGVGYTYTVGRNGGAIADILRREIPGLNALYDALPFQQRASSFRRPVHQSQSAALSAFGAT
jgi:L-alanine-DL-glutamate epimerase-like enolase superfamily enzyme